MRTALHRVPELVIATRACLSLVCVALAALTPTVAAQQPGTQQPPPTRQVPQPTPDRPANPARSAPIRPLGPVERVVAIVGNDVILESSLSRRVYGILESYDLASEPSTSEIAQLRLRELANMIRSSMLAQTAPTLGAYEPEQIGALLDAAVADLEARLVRQFGSYSKFAEELARSGQTWDEMAAEERQRQLEQFAQSQVAVGLELARGHQDLLFTPSEMLTYYHANPEMFSAEAHTDLGAAVFSDLATAEKAAEAWRASSPPQSPKELVEEFSGLFHEDYTGSNGFSGAGPGLPEPKRDDRAAFLWEAAQTLSEGEVLVHTTGASYWVLRVLGRVDADNRPFTDRTVQRQIRRELSRRFNLQLRETAFRRSQQRIQLWSPDFQGIR